MTKKSKKSISKADLELLLSLVQNTDIKGLITSANVYLHGAYLTSETLLKATTDTFNAIKAQFEAKEVTKEDLKEARECLKVQKADTKKTKAELDRLAKIIKKIS
jgi:hypothetical protein